MANLGNAISVKGLGDRTAEAQRARSKEFLIKKYSELCELRASAVNILSQETRKNQNDELAEDDSDGTNTRCRVRACFGIRRN